MGWFDWLKNKQPEAAPPAVPLQDLGPSRAEDDPSYARSFEGRQAYWAKLGTLEADVLSYLISPGLLGGFAWPTTRQAFVVVRTPATLIIASDGLSDPFYDQPDMDVQGFEMEIYGEFEGLQDLPMDRIMGHPAFELVQAAASLTAEVGGLTGQLAQSGILSTEMDHNGDLGPVWIAQGRIGALLGMHAKKRPKIMQNLPFGDVRAVPVTVLTRSEIDAAAQSKAARDRVAKALRDSGLGHVSDFTRAALI